MSLRSRTRVASAGAILLLALAGACDGGALGEHMKRGDAALGRGHYAQALSAYGHARELAPNDPAVQRALMRARAYALADNPTRLTSEGLEDARYEAELLLETDKGREAVYLTVLANILTRQGDVEGARIKLAEALKADPESVLAHTALGLLWAGKKDGLGQAKAELQAALKIQPDHAGALVVLGQVELAQGDLAGASEQLEAALRAGDDLRARMALGNVRVQQQKPAEAAEQFRRAADLEPRNADVLASLGQALLDAGKAEEAERALRAAAQLRSDEPTQIALGFALARQRKLDPALGVFAQVLASNPAAAPALYGAASASEGLGKTAQALDLYRRLMALPAEGDQKQVVLDLQKDTQGRLAALEAAASASAAPSSSAVARAGPAAPAPKDGLGPRR
jgi:tetratricopeptide (TPR) repeat protein